MRNIVILGASVIQEPLYIEAKNLGINVISIDQNKSAVCKKYAAKFICLSFKNTKKCISEIKKLKLKIDGVVTFGVEASIYVAKIAEEFNLKSVNRKVAEWTTHKALRSERLLKKKILIPKFFYLKKYNKEKKFNYPFILKPTDSSGSRGVHLVSNDYEYKKYFNCSRKYSTDKSVVIEEYVKGQEFSIEGFVINKKVFITGLADRHYLDVNITKPYIVEYMGIMPPNISIQKKNLIINKFKKAVKALQIDEGPTKGDLIVKNNKVYILEVTSRTSPTFASETQKLSTGINIPKILLLWSLNKKIESHLFKNKTNRYVCHRYFIHKKGVIDKISNFNKIKKFKGVKILKILNPKKKGDRLDSVQYMNRIFYIITSDKSYYKAKNNAERALDSFSIKYLN